MTEKTADKKNKGGRKSVEKLCKTPEAAAMLKELFTENEVTAEKLKLTLPSSENGREGIKKATAEKYLAHPETIPLYCAQGVAVVCGFYLYSDLYTILDHAGSSAVSAPGLALSPFKGCRNYDLWGDPGHDISDEPLQPYIAPHGMLGLLYVYAALSERDRETLLSTAEHLFKTAEPYNEIAYNEGSDAVVAAMLGQSFGYMLGEAQEHVNEYSKTQDFIMMQNRADETLAELPTLDRMMAQRVSEVMSERLLSSARWKRLYNPDGDLVDGSPEGVFRDGKDDEESE